MAVQSQNEACAAQLLESGVEIEAKTNNGVTALCYAVFEGNIRMVNLLLEHGANPCAKWLWGQSLLSRTPRKAQFYSEVQTGVKEQILAILKEAELAWKKSGKDWSGRSEERSHRR